jgi:hypothetical protein
MKELVIETLKCIGCYSEDAVNLILGVIAQESSFGKYRRQIGGGPALGIVQMEINTHNDIVKNFLIYHKDLGKKILSCAGIAAFSPLQLEGNDKYAICMARMQFYRRPTPIPHRLEEQAAMWKKYYNTFLGAGTVEEYIKNYNKYVVPLNS